MVKSRVKTFSSGEMEVLSALCDTFLPSTDDPHQDYHLSQFYNTSASMAGTPSLVAESLGKTEHPKLPLLKLAVTLLTTWFGTFILCGRKSLSPKFPYLQRFSKVSSNKRQEILLSWSTSYFSLLRILYAALKMCILLNFFTQVNEKNENLSWKAIGYCGPDPDFKARKPDKKTDDEEAITKEDLYGPLHKQTINFSQPKEACLAKLQTLGFPLSEPKNKAIKRLNPSFVVKCDAVVVGSGSGGGVVAGVLAKAGHKVLVLEKGSYLARSNLTLLEGKAMDQMYLQGGLIGTDDMDVLILAGSTVGGGSTVNWSASIKTPQHVRKEWSEKHNLELFESKDYEQALDVVCKKMGVQSEFEHEGFHNSVLRKGCKNLGYEVENIPRNAPPDHYCGWCCLGCRDGRKQGTAETWLVDVVNSKNGVVLAECEALKVIVEKRKGRKRAVGVAFAFQTQRGEEIGVVEARVVVAAGGAISTPPFLRRSGLKNPNIGRNLHLHPVVMAWGYFPDSESNSWPEKEKTSYEGGIMTAMSKAAANFETSGYGAVIQTPALHPGMFSALMPWLSGSDIKHKMVRFSRTAHVFALARDRGSGSVSSETNISYKVDKSDQESIAVGLEKVLRILAAAGAEEIGTHHRTGKVLRVKEASEEEFERFVMEESLRPLEKLSTPVCSAHQMGSCRMGAEPRGSAVSPKGETWEVEGLFVADSSVFPTALGVNPMVTVQAISYCTAQSILEALGNIDPEWLDRIIYS